MNEPTYKIHGIERRQVKKELGELKRYAKNFWYYHQLDKDMTSLYGGKDGYTMSDDEAQKRVDKANEKIKELEERLSVLYGAQRFAYMRSGTCSNLKLSTNVYVPFLIYAVSSSTDLNHKCSIGELNLFLFFLCDGKILK